jgi:hypothetical protein
MIAVAGGGTNAMDVSKNVRAWRYTRCPARLQACCPGGGLFLLVAWASADVRQVLLQQPHARHPSPILEGLLSRYRLARGAIASFCRRLRVCVFRLVTMVRIWCTRSLGRLNLLDFLLRHNALAGGHPGPRKKTDAQPLLLLVDTAIEGARLPTRARNNDTWDRRRIVNNMR